MWFNPIMSFILRSPFHAMLGDTMLVTVTGRKSRKKYTTPVGFYRDSDILWIISSRDRTWWRNVQGGAQVEMRIHGKDVTGFAEAILDDERVTAQVRAYVRHIPMSAKGLGVRMENDEPHPEDAARLAKERMFVSVKLDPCP